MPDFLTSAITAGPALSWGHVAVRLIVALLLGRVVAQVYEWSRLANERTPSFSATLVLLAVLIAMVTQVIGDNVARAFSLVGALSIVRFRTVVRDTEDTAFVIFAVIVGMAVGGNNLPVALTGIVVVAVAAFWMKPKRMNGSASAEYVLNLRVSLGKDLETFVGPTLSSLLNDHRLLSVGTAKQGTSIEASYIVRMKTGKSVDELVQALNRLDGVQNVEVTSPKDDDEDD